MQKTTLANAISIITGAGSFSLLMSEFDKVTTNNKRVIDDNASYGVNTHVTSRDALIKRRIIANREAEDVLERVGKDHTLLTPEDREKLRAYSGRGGFTSDDSSTDEYYTPAFLAEGMWDLLADYGLSTGNGLEPSCGTGVFNGTKPDNVIMTGTEVSGISSQINQLLHPEDKIHNENFEKLAARTPDNTFDFVTGNVPFGDTRGGFGGDDPEYQDIARPERYFVTRSIDKARAGGLIVLIVPTGIIDHISSKGKDLREMISRKAEFLGAHRIPSGTFSKSGSSSVVTDVLVMQKHSTELAKELPNHSDETLRGANVLWETFISGKWFKKEGKRFIHGDIKIGGGRNGSDTVVPNSKITNASIKTAVSKRFNSRIDHGLLNNTTPTAVKLAVDGDERLINGRWHVFVDDEWITISAKGQTGNILNKDMYGAATLDVLQEKMNSRSGPLDLSLNQLLAVRDNFPNLVNAELKSSIDLALKQSPALQEQVLRGCVIGSMVEDYTNLITNGNDDPDMRERIKGLVNREAEKYGEPRKNKSIKAMIGKGTRQWNSFSTCLKADGEYSDLLNGKLERGGMVAYDSEDASEVIRYMFNQMDARPISIDEFLLFFQGEVPEGVKPVDWLASFKDIAITPDGTLEPMDCYCSGDIVEKSTALRRANRATKNKVLKAKYQQQLKSINDNREWTNLNDISIGLNTPWLDKSLMVEFLRDSGYEDFKHGEFKEKNGKRIAGTFKEGKGKQIAGYHFHTSTGGKRGSSVEVDLPFAQQLENYLNGKNVSHNDKVKTAATMRKIKRMEADFQNFIRTHDSADSIELAYNDTFNRYIDYEHSHSDLGLDNVADTVKLYGYQNSAIRKLSEDGRGILSFGTGLGKTFSALGLTAYNIKTERATKTCIVVPKSLIENWYHETKDFYGASYMSNILFVGINPIKNEDGVINQEQVLNEQGKPKINKHTGNPVFRDSVEHLNSDQIRANMALIPVTNYKIIVMTKEQFAAIPMLPESKEAYVDHMMQEGLLRSAIDGVSALVGTSEGMLQGGKGLSGYKGAKKRANFKAKMSDEGTQKSDAYPFFENMGIDNVIVDEAHNYRNSYAAGFESSRLAHLPTSGTAKSAIDLNLKSAYLRQMNKGRGTVLLTATPTVNSPTDMFNMLSLCIDVKEWQDRYNIANVDDFIKVFGQTEQVDVVKLDGSIEEKQGLTGFQNLKGLRSLYKRWINQKSAKEVAQDVDVPDITEQEQFCDMNDEQTALYEEMRQRAEDLQKLTKEERENDGDSVFSIIRDMDKVSSDLDLYYKQITYILPIEKLDAVNGLVAALPASLKVSQADSDKEDEDSIKEAGTADEGHNAKVTEQTDTVTLVVNAAYEVEVNKRLKKFKIKDTDISHPVVPKYARLIAECKRVHEAGGKQLIFNEEKSTHLKLKRLLMHHIDIEENQIAIINADTTAGTGKKKKDLDEQQETLEGIAQDYNNGKHRIIIANKKCEVGVNLHMGTTDIHHLTIPWHSASIKQRNGRGARVGSSQSEVKAHYYCSKGSFDEFRLNTVKRKANWIEELIGGDSESAKNGSVDDELEAEMMLSQDPEALKELIAKNEAKKLAAARLKDTIEAQNSLLVYLKNSATIQTPLNVYQSRKEAHEERIGKLKEQIANASEYTFKDTIDEYKRELAKKEKLLREANSHIKRFKQAENKIKQHKSQVKNAIEEGLLDVSEDVLTYPNQFSIVGKRVFAVGENWVLDGGSICTIEALNVDQKTADVTTKFYSYNPDLTLSQGKTTTGVLLSYFKEKTEISNSEIEVKKLIKDGIDISSPSGWKGSFDKTNIHEYSDRLDIKTGVSDSGYGYVCRKNGEFYLVTEEQGTNYKGEPEVDYYKQPVMRPVKKVRKEDIPHLVLPFDVDPQTKAELALFMLNQVKENPSLNKIAHLNAIMGEEVSYRWDGKVMPVDYTQHLGELGKIPEQEITDWIANIIEWWDLEFQEKPSRDSGYNLTNLITRKADALQPEHWLATKPAFEARDTLIKNLSEQNAKRLTDLEAIERVEAEKQRVKELALIDSIASDWSSADIKTVISRLTLVGEHFMSEKVSSSDPLFNMFRYSGIAGETYKPLDDELLDLDYNNRKTLRIKRVEIDLARIGFASGDLSTALRQFMKKYKRDEAFPSEKKAATPPPKKEKIEAAPTSDLESYLYEVGGKHWTNEKKGHERIYINMAQLIPLLNLDDHDIQSFKGLKYTMKNAYYDVKLKEFFTANEEVIAAGLREKFPNETVNVY